MADHDPAATLRALKAVVGNDMVEAIAVFTTTGDLGLVHHVLAHTTSCGIIAGKQFALAEFAVHGDVDAIELLLEGGDLWMEEIGTPPLLLVGSALLAAARGGHTHTMRLLINHRRTKEYAHRVLQRVEEDARSTPLWEAATHGRVGCLQVLLAVPGIVVNLRGMHSQTPLYAAVHQGNFECARRLLAHKADPRLRNYRNDRSTDQRYGSTPLQAALLLPASEHGASLVAQLARHKTAELNRTCDPWVHATRGYNLTGSNTLHLAVLQGDPATVAVIMWAGGDRFMKDTDGRTPHQLAQDTPTGKEILKLFHRGIDYWRHTHHRNHSHAMQGVVLTLMLVRVRINNQRRTPRASAKGQRDIKVPQHPLEITMLIARFMRSADWGP